MGSNSLSGVVEKCMIQSRFYPIDVSDRFEFRYGPAIERAICKVVNLDVLLVV